VTKLQSVLPLDRQGSPLSLCVLRHCRRQRTKNLQEPPLSLETEPLHMKSKRKVVTKSPNHLKAVTKCLKKMTKPPRTQRKESTPSRTVSKDSPRNLDLEPKRVSAARV
jgi:hypothetical protein